VALAITSEMKGPRFDSKSEIPEQAIEPMISHGNHMEITWNSPPVAVAAWGPMMPQILARGPI